MRANSPDVLAAGALLAWGAGYLLAATRYPMGDAVRPGPGLVPAALGVLMVCLSAYLLAAGLRAAPRAAQAAPHRGGSEKPEIALYRPVQLVGVLVLYVAAIEPLGFLPSTLFATLFTCRLMGLRGWVKPIVLSLAMVLFVHLTFVLALGVPLPPGRLWRW